MSSFFFQNTEHQSLLSEKIRDISGRESFNEAGFAAERDFLIIGALQLFIKHASLWDERVPFNIEQMGDAFIRELSSPTSEENLNLLFSSCFRFYMENYIFDKQNHFQLTAAIKDFGIYRQNEFDKAAADQITYALREMPLNIMRQLLMGDTVKSYREYLSRANDLQDASNHWDEILKDNLAKSQALNDSLVMQLNKFNFVGLYKGFAELGENKKNELFWAKIMMFTLGVLIPIPLIIEAFLLTNADITSSAWSNFIRILPILSLTIILIYFFRVSLMNFNSVRAQLIQIDLRKSLCQFIQNYAAYAKDIREQNTDLLVKFEEVIFSNIMPSEDKIPSTFDGLEQLTNLIGALKKGG
ncbi:hypothetical protein QYY51_17820 [Enterobacter hormaechei]|uniref:hypothetical protein n=1 Tax=Enterobacter hormaechei TaxID=158836 RepID=UPI00263B9E8D|nr:hypothetical protein [Enterobacter hormaechei]MDN4966007.1 hypothetical protein [Enterobacter hormaechei]MDO6154180.1 hypothetical protein [Enterobacter hormaechei]